MKHPLLNREKFEHNSILQFFTLNFIPGEDLNEKFYILS